MTRSKRERLSSVDTAWLRMDRPSNLMIICGVLVLGEPVAFDRLRKALEQRFLRFDRFRQHAVQGTGAWWQDDDAFDIGRHLKRVALPGRAGKAELEAFVSSLVSKPLDPAHPMWQFHLVERYETGSAIVIRIHHSYADGIALIQVMLSLTDADRAGATQGPVPPPRESAPEDDAAGDPLVGPLSGALKLAMKTGSMLIEKGVDLWHDPARAVALAGQAQALTAEIVRLATMGEDSRTRFKGRPSVVKRVAWADPVPLADVKAIGRAYDCSINDVLMSAVAGALRSYLVSHGDDVDGAMLRALVPVNLRPPDKAYKLGNRFGLVFLDLPLGIANPVERLYAVRANMRALKGSYQPVLSLGILAAMGAGPKMLQEELLALLAKNATAVMTNVPGPQQPLFLAGAKIDSMMFWVPQSGDIGMGVSILSYDGAVQFGVIADRGLCPDPDRLIDRFAPEFDKLVMATLLSPWPWQRPPTAPEVERAVFGAP